MSVLTFRVIKSNCHSTLLKTYPDWLKIIFVNTFLCLCAKSENYEGFSDHNNQRTVFLPQVNTSSQKNLGIVYTKRPR